ncbi:MAG: efflux RND transporter periplasmic adaptor subunit [Phycisphaerales bacterium]
MSTADLGALTGAPRSDSNSVVPRPPRRWATRVLIPASLLLGMAGVLAFAARGTLLPPPGVWVAPVVLVDRSPTPIAATGEPASSKGEPAALGPVLVQAPGWIEADPYSTTVPVLAEGFVREVLVLEGERVEMDQVVARLIEDDARLALEGARAERDMANAELSIARRDADVAQARVDEVVEDRRRKTLAGSAAVSALEISQLELRERTMEREVLAAQARVASIDARLKSRQVAVDEAELRLSRMEIRAPITGVVQTRTLEPGMRVGMPEPMTRESMGTGQIRLYDPARIQARVDVPIADAARVGIGSRAEVICEALPNRAFHGEVTRIVHEADIQRNTVQMKVRIHDPSEILKPEMLVRVRLYSKAAESTDRPSSDGNQQLPSTLASTVSIPAGAVVDGKAAWVVIPGNRAGTSVTRRRDITFQQTTPASGAVNVTTGLSIGDRVIVDPPTTLTEGARVRILGEWTEQTHQSKESTHGSH